MVSRDSEPTPNPAEQGDTDLPHSPPSGRRSWSNDPLIGQRLGEYQIKRVVGRGGMGSVYEALHLFLHKRVAIKVLASHLLDDPRAVERFRREMRAIGRVNSPYIVQAFDASLTGDIHYLVMEFVDGVDADELVRRLHGVPVEDACEIVRQAALGLADAHSLQLVHRDIKPKNLAVSLAGRVKILDLGLALCKAEVVTTGRLTEQAAIGSYQYMAPEQFDDSHAVDIRADLYSLGCTLYHLLTGQPPFSGERYRSLTSLMEAHRSQTPAPVIEANGLVSVELSAIIDRLLAKRPEDRLDRPEVLAELLLPHAVRANLPAIVAMACPLEGSPATSTDRTLPGSVDRSTPALSAHATTQGLGSGRDRSAWHRPAERSPRALRWLISAGGAVFAVLIAFLFYSSYTIRKELKETGKRQAIAEFIQTMPGLNGNWWFDETPWLLPSIREDLALGLIGGEDATGNSRTIPSAAEEWVVTLAEQRKDPSTTQLERQLRAFAQQVAVDSSDNHRNSFFSIQGDDPESLDENKLRLKLENIAQWHLTNETTPSPVDIHVQAVVRHKQGRFTEAESLYSKAISLYEKAGFSSSRSGPGSIALMLPILVSDYGEMLYATGRFDDAALQFRLASAFMRDQGPKFPELMVYSYCRESDSLRKSVDGRSKASEALSLAKPFVELLPPQHPLSAFYHERQGWLALDEGLPRVAGESFEHAIQEREKNAADGNRRATFFLYFDEQGLAMAERLQGRWLEAKSRLEKLAERVDRARTEPKRLSTKQRSELESRYLNALERLADFPLYDQGQLADARAPLARAIEFVDRESLKEGRLARHIDRIKYKLTIAQAAAGKETDATKTFASTAGTSLVGVDLAYRDLAKASLAWANKDPAAGESCAKIVLQVSADRASRDEAELCLLAARLFYSTPACQGDRGIRVVRRHARVAMSLGREDDPTGLLRYLRPHFDALVLAASQLTDFPTAEWNEIITAAVKGKAEAPTPDTLLFFFVEQQGFALDTDASGVSTLLTLPFGSQRIMDARSDKQARADLAQQTPDPVVLRLRSLPKERVLLADPVRELVAEDAALLVP